MDEFALINLIRAEIGAAGAGVVLGPGDDCAIVRPLEDEALAASIDTLVADVHFPGGAAPALIGYRALAVNLSDLAAMGAVPWYCLIALTLPENDPGWVRPFAQGVAMAADRFGCVVAGGNIARGPLSITVSIHGRLPTGQGLLRSGARSGDRVLVSGQLGAAAAALRHPELERVAEIEALAACGEADPRYVLRRYYLPEPRLGLGAGLRGVASAAIDVSDGLLADLGHIVDASRCGADVALENVPCAAGADRAQSLAGGDDYELCVTVPPDRLPAALAVAEREHVRLSDIGEIVADAGVRVWENGALVETTDAGYRHFR